MGGKTTYGDIAAHIGNPHARHAVGTAVGENPVTFFIPCHRVVRATREIGNYHFFFGGGIRKASIIGWEAVKKESHSKK